MNSKIHRQIAIVICTLFFITAACALPTAPTQTPQNLPQTQAAATLNALMTEVAHQSGTSTPDDQSPAQTPEAPTLAPSATALPTDTQVVLPSASPTQICDAAGFVADVSVSDGSVITAGTQFVKTWRLKNTGSCTWTPQYAIVFDSGDAMEGPAAQTINQSISPNQTVDVSVTLKAPGQPGSYRGYWKMRNAAGVIFGLGNKNEKFYVDIKVISVTPSSGSLDFAAVYCQAEWTGNDKALPCLGTDGNPDGFVLYTTKPVLETGYVDDEPSLITNPPKVNDGVVRGKFPPFTVSTGDRFKSIIGCEHNAKNCNVRFQLDYQIDNGAIQTFAAWNEKYDESFTQVDIDLSPLAGSNVKFILTVLANGASDGDRALWLRPRIE